MGFRSYSGVESAQLVIEELNSLERLFGALDGDDFVVETACPGWSVQDQLSHVIGIEKMLLGDDAPSEDAPDYEFVKNDVGRVNERDIELRRSRPPEQVMAEFVEVKNRRVEALQAMSEQELQAPSFTPTGPGTYSDFMRIRAMDIWVHEQDVRRALLIPGNLDSSVAQAGVTQLLKGLPMVFKKRAGACEGQSLVMRVGGQTDPVVARVCVVDGRAVLVDSLEGAPTSDIELSTEAYVGLATGRLLPADVEVLYGGDAELGAKVISSLNIMI